MGSYGSSLRGWSESPSPHSHQLVTWPGASALPLASPSVATVTSSLPAPWLGWPGPCVGPPAHSKEILGTPAPPEGRQPCAAAQSRLTLGRAPEQAESPVCRLLCAQSSQWSRAEAEWDLPQSEAALPGTAVRFLNDCSGTQGRPLRLSGLTFSSIWSWKRQEEAMFPYKYRVDPAHHGAKP